MKAGGSKAKGSNFEREVCAKLSIWITQGKHKDCLWRSAMSGGRATVHLNRGETNRQAGDICAVAPEGHLLTDAWYIECKHYRDLNLTSFFIEQRGLLYSFWLQTRVQARKHKRSPMLIAKENRRPVLVLVGRRGLRDWADGKALVQLTSCDVWLLDELTKHACLGGR